jgi:predicted ribosome quality control (RQC) complex YloA/Tae2 family protein
MDYLSLKAAVAESAEKLTGKNISDTWQSESNVIVLMPGQGHGMILSIDPARPGIFLCDRHKLPERIRSAFSDLLQARIKGRTLISMEIPEHGERVVDLTFSGAWPEKKGTPLKLMFEVMGRRSNVMLTEEGRILLPLRAVPKEKSRARPVLAGEIYHPPPPNTGTPLEDLTHESLPPLESPRLSEELLSHIRGLSPYAASQALEAAHQDADLGDGESVRTNAAVVLAIEKMLASCTGDRGFLHRSRGKTYLSPFRPLACDVSDTVEEFSPFSVAAEKWRESDSAGPADAGDEASRLERGLRGRLDRISSAMLHVNSEEERCRSHEEYRIMAEALLISATEVRTGSTSVELTDPYDAGLTLSIPLDRTKSPQENANDMFASARRLKRGLEEVRSRREGLEDERKEVQLALKTLVEGKDPQPARKILEGTDIAAAGKGKKSRSAYSGPGRRHVVEGFSILVGRSSTDNEKVTFQAAGPNDLWLHARDYPGSHVVVMTEKRKVPDKVLYEAAALAAAGSGAKNDAAPEIMVTERKWVRKLKGGKPGQVTVQRFRTIRPRTDRLKSRVQRPKGKNSDS